MKDKYNFLRKIWVTLNFAIFFLLYFLLIRGDVYSFYYGLFGILLAFSILGYSIYFKKFGNARGILAIFRGFIVFFIIILIFNPSLIFGLIFMIHSDFTENQIKLIFFSILAILAILLRINFERKVDGHVRYWKQSSDFSIVEGDLVNYNQAKRLVKEYNWHEELSLKRILESKKKESCNPGIGFTRSKEVFHIYSPKNGVFNVYINGIKRIRNLELKNLGETEIYALLKNYFDKDYSKFIK